MYSVAGYFTVELYFVILRGVYKVLSIPFTLGKTGTPHLKYDTTTAIHLRIKTETNRCSDSFTSCHLPRSRHLYSKLSKQVTGTPNHSESNQVR